MQDKERFFVNQPPDSCVISEEDSKPRAVSKDKLTFCIRCDYPLRKLGESRCPECGRWFDWEDDSTLLVGRPLSRYGRRIARPMGWGFFGSLAVLVIVLLALAAQPGFYYMMWFIWVFLFWLIFAALISMRLAMTPRQWHVLFALYPDAWKRPIYAIGIVLLCMLALVVQLPLRLAFLPSLPVMNHLVEEAGPELHPQMQGDVRAGLYRISAVDTQYRYQHYPYAERGRIVFMLSSDSEAAFIYSPDGVDNLSFNSGTTGHLIGSWYWMKED